MKKKILSVLLCLCMVCMLLPTAAFAEEAQPEESLPGEQLEQVQPVPDEPVAPQADGVDVSKHTNHTSWTEIKMVSGGKVLKDNNEWTANAAGYYVLDSGNYYLGTQISLGNSIQIPRGATVTLCLNGKTITGANGEDAIIVATGATLNLTECNERTIGQITHETGQKGRGVYVNGTFNMYGGSITGNSTTTDYNATSKGGGVYVNGSSAAFNMCGGSITGNTAAQDGGGVYVENGKFKMTAGTIGGTATENANTAKNGGGVYVVDSNPGTVPTCTFDMTGGSITGNKATENGGGVFAGRKGTFTMTGGTIGGTATGDANTAKYGGGVAVVGTFNMSDNAAITGNTAETGGGVYVSYETGSIIAYGKFTMSGGTISGNMTASGGSGGGVFVNYGGTFTMTGGTIGGTNENDANTAKNGGGVYVGSHGEFTMSNSASITGNTASGYGDGGGVFVNEGGTFQMSDDSRITGNTGYHGGGVSVDRNLGTTYNPGAFTMSSGNITDNNAQYGGGVYISGNFTMSGGKISSNRATGDSGGVHMNTDSTFTVSGAPKITGNTLTNDTINNVCLSKGTTTGTPDATITIGDAHLSTGASIGVTTEKKLTTGSSVTIATGAVGDVDYTKIFKSDAASQGYVVIKDGNDLKLSTHRHSWQYTLSEDKTTITATCTAAGCTSTPYSETLTISAPEPAVLTYDGNVKAATLSSQSGLVSDLKTVEVNYQKKTGDSTYDTATTTAPTNAGTYTASITVGGQTASVVYTIAPKSVTDPTIEVASGSTYDGTEQKPAVTVKDGTTVIDSNEYTVAYSNNINAGTATVTVTDNDGGNYTLSEKQQTFEIARRSITEAEASSVADQTYTGSQIKPDVTLTYNGKTLGKDTDYTLTYGDNTTVGSNSGSITFTAKDGGNYTGTKTVNFNIVAKPGQVTISGDLNVTYGTEVPDVTIDRHGSTGTTTVYYYTDSNCNAGETTTKPTTAGDYWVKVKMAAAGNYGAAESTALGFTISKANITPTVTITGWTYKDSANAPSVTGNTGSGSVTYAYKVQSAGDDTYSNTVPTAAGDYTVKATVAETTNYNGGSATANFTISPKDISGVTIAAIAAQTYNNGTAITPTPAVQDGDTTLTVGTDFTYGYENNINVGDSAVVKVVGKGNYTGTASKNFTISRADLTITVNIIGWVVGGTPNAPSVNGNTGNGTVTYQYKVKGTDDSTYTATVPTAVGDYTVKATVAQTANYNAASATTDFSISTKAVQTITAGDVTVTYGDSNKAVSGTTSGDGTISYAVKSGDEFVEVNSSTGALTIKKVGTATITVSAAETASYAAASKDITVTVNPLAVTAPAADTTVFTYNGQNQTYGVTETANYSVSNGIQKNAGNYTVTVALKDQVNTVWADSNNTTDKTFGFEIKKATITIAAKNKSAYVNDTAPALGEGDYTVSGLVTGESLKTLPAIAYASTPDMTKAGTVSITVSGAEAPDGGNYNDIIYNNGTLTISTRPSSGGGSYTPPTYKVESEVSKNDDGSVSFSKNNAKKGDTVTITVTPDRYYKVDGVTVKDSNGKEIAVTDNGDGTFTFKMPASKVTVEPTFSWDNPFADVSEEAYYAPAVEWALKNDVTNGTGDGTFSPNVGCTRAQIVTFLWRAAGCPEPAGMSSFTDVSVDAYYAKAVAWAVEKGVTNGTSETTFFPDDLCTRAQILTFLWRAVGSPAPGISNPFTDVPAGADYARAVAWAVEKGVTNGTSETTFSPDMTCSRGQIVTFLYRAVK